MCINYPPVDLISMIDCWPSGVNDSLENARELADLLKGRPLLINLIPYNANVTAKIHGFTG